MLVRRNSGITGGEEGLSLNTDQVPDFLIGVINTRNLYWFALAVLVVVYLVTLWVDTSRLGHLARATRENEQRVRVLGLRPYRVKLIVFVIAAVLASLAGVAYMLLQSGTVPRAVSADLTITDPRDGRARWRRVPLGCHRGGRAVHAARSAPHGARRFRSRSRDCPTCCASRCRSRCSSSACCSSWW